MMSTAVQPHPSGCVVVVVTGEVDSSNAQKLLLKLDQLVEQDRTWIIVDMSGVTFCGTLGVSALVRTRSKAQSAGGWLRLAGCSDHFRRVLQVSGRHRMFPRYDTVSEAVPGGRALSGGRTTSDRLA
jgi:anti-sigma B factor antagonist